MKILKRFHAWRINRKQEEVNQLLASEGFTEEVLDKQAKVNELRHKHDLADETKIVHEKYVQ